MLHSTGMALRGQWGLSLAGNFLGPLAALGLALAIAYGVVSELAPGARFAGWSAEVRTVARFDRLFVLILVGFWLVSVANKAMRGGI